MVATDICDMTIQPALPADLPGIIQLHERAFGPGRFARTAFRVREGCRSVPGLSLVAVTDGVLAGAIQFTELSVGARESGALLLGPLVVDAAYAGRNCGLRLIREGTARARDAGHELVILVGDLPYYQRAGFTVASPGKLVWPGPVDPQRVLLHELVPDARNVYQGPLRGHDPLTHKPMSFGR